MTSEPSTLSPSEAPSLSKQTCRTCLTTDRETEFVSIFGEEDSCDGDQISIVSQIKAVVSKIEIEEGDGLPDLICKGCREMLATAYKFYSKCERSDAHLRHRLGRLWPDSNPKLKECPVRNINNCSPSEEAEPMEGQVACLVTVEQENDADGGDESLGAEQQSSEYSYDNQDYEMHEAVSLVKSDKKPPEAIPNTLSPSWPIVSLPAFSLVNHLQVYAPEIVPPPCLSNIKDSATLALRETQNTSVPRILPAPLNIPNVSVSLINKNARHETFPGSASSLSQDRNRSRRSNKKNDPCDICGKSFKDRFAMKVHQRTHSGEKPFMCPICSKSFRQKAHLGKHSLTHRNDRKPPPSASNSLVKRLSEEGRDSKIQSPNANTQSITVPIPPVSSRLEKINLQTEPESVDAQEKSQSVESSPEPLPLTVASMRPSSPATRSRAPQLILPRTTLTIPMRPKMTPKPNITLYLPNSAIPTTKFNDMKN